MALTRDEIARAALAMIDEAGLDKLTLRALATRLGVSAPTLYWHVRDKRHLLDLVSEQLAADVGPQWRREPDPGEPVTAWLAEQMTRQRDALLAHRDSVWVVAGNRPTPDGFAGIERVLRVLVDAGLEPAEAVRVLTAIGSYVLGDVLETQATAQRARDADGAGEAVAQPRPAAEAFGPELPLLRAAAAGGLGRSQERFAEGLHLLLDGLQARLDRRASASRTDAPTEAGTRGDPR